MATRREEFIAGEGLDDLYAILDNGFLEDVDFEKDFVAMSVPKFVKLGEDLRYTKIQYTTPVEVVVVFQLAAKRLFKITSRCVA